MLRTRVIRPSICYNEDLGKLGPVVEVIFTRLWMLADREGRLEYRPERIKIEALGNYPQISTKAVEKAVENLWKSGMVTVYTLPNGRSVIEITHFKKHQWVHATEKKSEFPPPPETTENNGDILTSGNLREPPGEYDDVPDISGSPRKSHLVTSSVEYVPTVVVSKADEGRPPSFPDSDPDPNGHGTRTRKRTRKPPGKAEAKPASRTGTGGAVDFWPYTADHVAYVRSTLRELGGLVGLPDPDDAIIRRTLDACRGAPGDVIRESVRALWFRGKFQNIKSWGLLPVVLGPWFEQRAAAS